MNHKRFEELNISLETMRAIKDMGHEFTTEIQDKSIPYILKGLDVIGKSQTGTGKTLAFGIPAIEIIDRKIKGVQVLILCPTRELVVQVSGELHKLTKFKQNIKIVEVYGGVPMDRQIQNLKRCSIVVGTPGRVMDHIRRGTLKLSDLKMAVLDEADEMLSMGFRDDMDFILEKTPAKRQTVLFSATMPPEIFALTHKHQKSPKLIEVNKKRVTVENISQFYYNVPLRRKMDALNLILRFYNPSLSIVFCNTKKMVDDVTEYLRRHGFSVEGIHGDMDQVHRMKVMNSFRQRNFKILVATDVAARGIDVNDIDYVINYDIPQNTEYYVHRIGRTGRAGKLGVAVTICSGRSQLDILLRIGILTKSKIVYREIPCVEEIKKKEYDRELFEIESLAKNEENLEKMYIVEELLQKGYEPKVIAAAVLQRLLRNQQCEIENIEQLNLNKHKPYKKIVINIGYSRKVEPRNIVGALTGNTNLRGKDIGKIEIFEDKTIVSIPSKNFDETVDKMKNCKICGKHTTTKVFIEKIEL